MLTCNINAQSTHMLQKISSQEVKQKETKIKEVLKRARIPKQQLNSKREVDVLPLSRVIGRLTKESKYSN